MAYDQKLLLSSNSVSATVLIDTKMMLSRSSTCVKAFEQFNVYGAFLAFVVHNFFRKNLMAEHFAAH